MAEMRLKQLLKKFHKDPEYEKEHRKAVKKSGTEIQTLTQPAEWRFVPGDQNVADLATPQQRFHFVQKLINMFWDIWIKKYLLSLTGLGQMEFAITIPIIFPYSTPIDESQPITAHQFDPWLKLYSSIGVESGKRAVIVIAWWSMTQPWSLTTRKKWQHKERNFEPGDVVLVMDPNQPRGTWKLGRISETRWRLRRWRWSQRPAAVWSGRNWAITVCQEKSALRWIGFSISENHSRPPLRNANRTTEFTKVKFALQKEKHVTIAVNWTILLRFVWSKKRLESTLYELWRSTASVHQQVLEDKLHVWKSLVP